MDTITIPASFQYNIQFPNKLLIMVMMMPRKVGNEMDDDPILLYCPIYLYLLAPVVPSLRVQMCAFLIIFQDANGSCLVFLSA